MHPLVYASIIKARICQDFFLCGKKAIKRLLVALKFTDEQDTIKAAKHDIPLNSPKSQGHKSSCSMQCDYKCQLLGIIQMKHSFVESSQKNSSLSRKAQHHGSTHFQQSTSRFQTTSISVQRLIKQTCLFSAFLCLAILLLYLVDLLSVSLT